MEQGVYDFIKELFTVNEFPIHFVKLPCQDWDWFDLGLRTRILGINLHADAFNAWLGKLSSSVIYHQTDIFRCSYTIFLPPDSDQYAVIGPVLFEEINGSRFDILFQKLALPEQAREPLRNHYFGLRHLSDQALYENFILSSASFIWDKIHIQVVHQAADELDPWYRDSCFHFQLAKQSVFDTKYVEDQYELENTIFEAVTYGNEKQALAALAKISGMVLPRRLANELRDDKNLCIALDAMLRKAAETAGAHPSHIDEYSNRNIQEIERITTSKQSRLLSRNMILGYCQLVNKFNLKNYSLPVRKTISYINTELTADLSLKSLSGRLNINANYLSTLFTKELGISLTEYVTRCRIEHAKHLLISSDMPIKKISEQCGFSDIYYFTRVFKRVASVTPKAYREQGASSKLWDRPPF